QRLSRPSINYLNPFVINEDSMNIRYGNPSLNAEVAHSFEIGYSIFTAKFNFSVSSYAFLINNSIESISKIQSNGVKVTTYDNIGKNQSYGLSLYSSYRAGVKFNIYFNGNAGYKKFEENNGYTINSEGFSYSGSLGGQMTLWKNGTFNANGGIYSPSVRFQGKSSSYFSTSLGLSQHLLKHKLRLSLSVSDPFWYKKTKTNESKDKTFYIRNQITSVSQTLRFSITYEFGKTNFDVKKAKHGINNDDLKN
ncbi:MAG: outer membrane beta-barrel family protein, partial [Bacteroidota bacterium]|nr:outer membrane beta-barrel family protein [Bacteroidota bacterium]